MLPVDAFNANAESVDEPWERDLQEITDEFLALPEQESGSRSFQSTSSGDSATATLLVDGLGDDSVRARSYELDLHPPRRRHLADRVGHVGAALPRGPRPPGLLAGALSLTIPRPGHALRRDGRAHPC